MKIYLMESNNLIFLDPALNLITVQGPNPQDMRCYDVQDEDCPAFVRKKIGFPLGRNIFDPETPAIERKNLGLKLQSYHLELEESYARRSFLPHQN
jgi:hypothetical protein